MNYPQGGNGWQQMPPPGVPPQPYPPGPTGYYAPGYYPPPAPPKKKKTWLWVLLALFTVIVLAVGGGIAFALHAIDRPVTLTYEVTGSGDSASIRYTVRGLDDTKQEDAAGLPWTMDVTTERVFQLTAYPRPGETVECKVSADGEVLKQEKSDAAGRAAYCWGAAPLF